MLCRPLSGPARARGDAPVSRPDDPPGAERRIRSVVMSFERPSPAAAVPGLVRSDPHRPGISRARAGGGFRYLSPAGTEITGG